jgi:hypothetical protein
MLPTQALALIAGLVGAIVSAVFAFAIRWYLDRHNERKAERRVAFVHLVQVSEIVALDGLARGAAKTFAIDEGIKSLASADGAYNPSHAISVLLHRELSKITPESLASKPEASAIVRVLRTYAEGSKEKELTTAQLATLPRDTILAYRNYLTARSYVFQCIELWLELFERGSGSWFTPELIHHHWVLLDSFVKKASVLRTALIAQSGISRSLARQILVQQIETLGKAYLSVFTEQPKIKAAMRAAADAVETTNDG